MCFPDNADGFLFQKVATIIGNLGQDTFFKTKRFVFSLFFIWNIGCLLCLNYGLLFGINSSQIILYQSPDTPLTGIIDTEAASLLGTYLCLGGIIGALVFGYASNRIGPKGSLLLCGLLQIACWFCILFGYNIDHMYSSRVMAGLAAGGTFVALPLYIGEICEEKNRRKLESLIDPITTSGLLIGFILAAFAPYDCFPIVGLCLSFVFNMFFPFMPESPVFYIRNGDQAMMEKSLRWLRGARKLDDRNNPRYIEELKNFTEQQRRLLKGSKIVSTGGSLTRLIVITAALVAASQLCGIFMIFHYVDSIFHEIGCPVPTYWAAIILAGAQGIGSLISMFVQERVNRRILLSISALFSGLCLLTLAALMSFNESLAINYEQMEWFILCTLIGHVVVASIGYLPLTHVVISEIASAKTRRRSIYLSMSFMWLVALLTVKFYYVLNDLIGFTGLLCIFGGFCVFEFFFTIYFVPETLKKSITNAAGIGKWASSTVR